MAKIIELNGHISRLVLHGYKSITNCNIELRKLNVLIGANGAGKSNLIEFFRLINHILNQQLQLAVGFSGGPDTLLHFGRKRTKELHTELHLGRNRYIFALSPTQDNRMMFSYEAIGWDVGIGTDWHSSHGHLETIFTDREDYGQIWDYAIPAMRSWRVYHFHDTGNSALVKQIHNINDNEYLRDDARNLAAFLLRLKIQHKEHYQRIIKTIRLVAPFFGDFHLRPTLYNQEKIQLEWTEQGQDEPFYASALSDGTLRFICLATVLLQPEGFMPSTILIDEPELGLHPFAISVLAELIKAAAYDHQLIVSTQSVELVNEFNAEDLIVVDKRDGTSIFSRPDTESLSEWLTEYSLGELWNKNILGGRPG